MCRDNDFDYLEFRLWIGLWSAFFCLVLVATDASFLVQYFTRFTEEGFSCLISFIFIYDAFKKMLKLAHHYPIDSDYKMDYVTQYDCLCMAPTILGGFETVTLSQGCPNLVLRGHNPAGISVQPGRKLIHGKVGSQVKVLFNWLV